MFEQTFAKPRTVCEQLVSFAALMVVVEITWSQNVVLLVNGNAPFFEQKSLLRSKEGPLAERERAGSGNPRRTK